MKPLHGKTVDLPYDQVLAKTEQVLADEGFGVLCRIDVKEKLKEKIGVEMEPYMILGACLPPMAHKAITAEPEIGIMLPCNVVVRQVEGGTRVEVVNTDAMVQMFPGSDVLKGVADEVGQRLDKALQAV
jgi:uncharacterized protein (DUF302 family)